MKRKTRSPAWRRAVMFNMLYGAIGGMAMMAAAAIALYHA